MKSLIFTVLTAISLNTWADATVPPGYREITGDKAPYITAVQDAGRNLIIKSCSNGVAYSLSESLNRLPNAFGLYISSSGQPALIFDFRTKTNETQRYEYYFTTSADHKTITAFAFSVQSFRDTNTGTLINPVITREWSPDSYVTCDLYQN